MEKTVGKLSVGLKQEIMELPTNTGWRRQTKETQGLHMTTERTALELYQDFQTTHDCQDKHKV